MKKKLYLLITYVVLGVTIGGINTVFAANPVIPYPAGYALTTEGASAYNNIGNVKNSPYYTTPDFFNQKSTDTLTILPNYQTYQQTTEFTCGPAAALTVLNYAGNTSWDERAIGKIMNSKEKIGTDTKGMVQFFKRLGWDVKSSLTTTKQDGATFSSTNEFKDFVLLNLKNNTPIMVENIDWSGHWRVIIGYDTLGTETLADDVLILADSYDTADHLQDGYVTAPVEKFYYMWFDAHMLPQDQRNQQWLTAKPH